MCFLYLKHKTYSKNIAIQVSTHVITWRLFYYYRSLKTSYNRGVANLWPAHIAIPYAQKILQGILFDGLTFFTLAVELISVNFNFPHIMRLLNNHHIWGWQYFPLPDRQCFAYKWYPTVLINMVASRTSMGYIHLKYRHMLSFHQIKTHHILS